MHQVNSDVVLASELDVLLASQKRSSFESAE